MDPLPNPVDLNLVSQYTSVEQSLLTKLRSDFQDLLVQKIDEVKDRFSSITSQTFDEHTKLFRKDILTQAESLFKLSSQPINSSTTKKLLTSLQTSIATLERLIFLARYFNPENDEDYLKMLSLRATKLTSIVYNFNSYIFSWIRLLLDGVHLDPKDLLAMQMGSKEEGVHAVTTNLFTTRIPSKPTEGSEGLHATIMLGYYHLESTYENIRGLLDIFTQSKIPEKIREMISSLTDDSNPDSPALQMLGEGFIKSNPVKLELEKELRKLEKAADSDKILAYLFESKQKVEKIMQDIPIYEDEIRTATIKYISQTFARREEANVDEDHFPIDKADDVILQEIQQYWATGQSNLQQFLKDWENEAKIEILRLINQQKDQLQDHMARYIEERLVIFYQGKGDFAGVNFAKHVQEFCTAANKEFKKVLTGRFDQDYEVWPLYYCFVAENQCDFYLVEYLPDVEVLKVYLTASPMLSTLNKHLSKISLPKIGKKSILVSALNYYDIDINLEFRQVFLNTESMDTSQTKSSKTSKLSQGLKDLIFTTVFLLHNTPEVRPLSSINFTTKDFAAFYNYATDFHNVYLQYTGAVTGNPTVTSPVSEFKDSMMTDISFAQNPPPQSPATFDFRAPFIDLKQPKHMFLVHMKGDVARENSVLLMRNIAQQYGESLKYQPLSNDEELKRKDFLDAEVIKYLKKNEVRPSFHFDGTEYLMTYFRKKKMNEGLVKILTKKQSQRLFEIFNQENKDLDVLPGLEDYSKYMKIFLIFSYPSENSPGLMLCINRKTSTVILHKHEKQTVEESKIFKDFAVFVARLLKIEEGDLNTVHIRYKTPDDTISKYLKNYYFPYTCLFKTPVDTSQSLLLQAQISMEDLVESFKDFLSLNISESSLEVFKVCNFVLQDKDNNVWKTFNLGTFLKFYRLKTALASLVQKIVQNKTKYTLVTFSFLGAMGYKTYYIYFCETFEKANEESRYGPQSPTTNTRQRRYLVDIYTLDYNLTLDDQEVLVIVAHVCQALGTYFSLNAACSISSRYNMLLHSHIDLTLSTIGYLVCLANMPIEKAFQRISRSIVSHYEVIEGLLDQVSIFAQTPVGFAKQRSLSAPQKSETFNLSQVKMADSLEKMSMMRVSFLKKTKTHDSFFDEFTKQAEFRRVLEAQIIYLLAQIEAKYFTENLDIYSFLNMLNCEDNPSPSVYTFVVDEQVMKKLLGNESNVLKNITTFLLEEVTSSKAKYEETLEIKYPETMLFFQISKSLFQTSRVLLIGYNIETAESTYFYVADKDGYEAGEPQERSTHNDTHHDGDNYRMNSQQSEENTDRLPERKESQDNPIHEVHSTGHTGRSQSRDGEEGKASGRDNDKSHEEVTEEGFRVPSNLLKLMENFSIILTRARKSKASPKVRYIELALDERIQELLNIQYGLVGKFLIYYFSHQGLYLRGDRVFVTPRVFNGFLCDYSDKLFGAYIESSRIKENYKQLCNMFLDKTCPLGKRVVLLAFLNGKATLDQLNVIETCIKSFKQDFQKIYGIENAFFCFTVNLKNVMKHFLVYLSGKGKKNLTIRIFTNGSGDDDTIVEKLIKTYCLTDSVSGGEDILVEKIQMFTINPPNLLFINYIEISTVLLANKVSNDVEDPVDYCAQLACSPMHYMNELRDFEAKCDDLGLLLDMPNLTSQASQFSQVSPS